MSAAGGDDGADAFSAKLRRLGVARGARAAAPAPPATARGSSPPEAEPRPSTAAAAPRPKSSPEIRAETAPPREASPATPESAASLGGPAWVEGLPAALRERLKRAMSAAPGAAVAGRGPAAARRSLPGAVVVRANGTVHVAESRMPRSALHGATRLDAATGRRAKTAAVAARDGRFVALDPDRWGYFDTETTSLNAGAGVWVFLVGVGRFRGDEFVVRQFLLTGPGGEEAFLDAVREEFSDLEALVSFHGKSFDAPRLDDRCRLGAWEEICAGRPHWDLLHVVRRLFAPRWPDGRLRTAEERLLRFERTDDLPGQECPAEYFAYVRGRPHRLGDVFEHNRLDTVSLAALAGAVAEIYADPQADELAALVAGVDWAAVGEFDHAGGLLRRGVPAIGHVSASMREKIRRALRRCGEKELAAALKSTGPPLAIPPSRAHTTSAQRS